MTALVAAILISTPAAPAAPPPPTGSVFVYTVLDITFYSGGYADGFTAGRAGKLPIPVFT
jgi:hypothetical protein